jgi:DNA-directed RNA polymerase specialized sigma24 family protein
MTTLTITEADLATLVEAGAAGDAAAWRSLVTRFEPRLRNVARAYRLAPTDVDDILQATWLCLFTHIGPIREPAAIGGWLATTVRRECLRLLQRPVRERLTADPERADARELRAHQPDAGDADREHRADQGTLPRPSARAPGAPGDPARRRLTYHRRR